jgi:hypothetical protein
MKSIKELLQNKYVFYTIFVIAIANILGYISKNDINSLVLFVAIYIICSHFTKNIIIRLLITVIATSFLRGPIKREWHWLEREGFRPEEEVGEEEEVEEEEEVGEEEEVEEDEKFQPMDQNVLESSQIKSLLNNAKSANSGNLSDQKKNLDAQYQNIQALLDPKLAGKNPNLDTKELKIKQDQLKNHMKDMQPIIDSTQKLLQTFESSGIMSMLDKLAPALNNSTENN